MGSDDLFHKKKKNNSAQKGNESSRKRNESSLKRTSGYLAPYERYLIVCEGSKTERYYFESLIDDYKLGNNVNVASQAYTCPLQLARYASNFIHGNQKDEDIEEKEEYDKVFCVFDKDKHAHYASALSFIKDKEGLIATNSVPCFEYWLILHFENTSKPFYSNPSKSAGDEAVTYLKKYIKKYEKGDNDIYKKTKKYMSIALKRAKVINKQAKEVNNDNPSTYITELVDKLNKLKASIYGK